ncbi:putative F-box protein At3g52320 isoform X2 [Salvia splendens]|uniref:putative F-box protein At3g52320 isoform X2 n=1 Tax=Salvia splendens TaxID=180675 RepID=UPI001C260371|nr:putative F-box protein At3g52320 isoform X2 [Salvia splendens]
MKISNLLEGDSECGIMNKSAKKGCLSVRKYTKLRDILFANLPEEITIEILQRLPIRSVMACKCVLKSWRHLIEGMSYTPKPCQFFVYGDLEMSVGSKVGVVLHL